jgi:hypothetical protein
MKTGQLLLSVCLLYFFGHGLPALAETVDDALTSATQRFRDEASYIAPMTKTGDASEHGPYTEAGSGIFTSILNRIGLKPGITEPKELEGREGFLEFIDQSIVLNECGTRATFGYFILNARSGGTYFVLFSYDHIRTKQGNACSGDSLFAFEVFLFGTIEEDGYAGDLRRGLAVGMDGRLLTEVPFDLAKVSNVLGKKDHEQETVKPGVEAEGKGCLACHARREGLSQATLPFPWIRPSKIDNCLVGTWEGQSIAPITAFKTPTGGEGFVVTFGPDGTELTDYSKMSPQEWDKDKPGHSGHTYRGTASARISTSDGSAKIESIDSQEVLVQIWQAGGPTADDLFGPVSGLGPGGLGGTASDNKYKCEGDTLEYKSSVAADKHATHAVKLTRVKK